MTAINSNQKISKRSLTFNKKPSPYIVLDGHKIYLKMDQYDSGILNKE